MNIPKEIDWEQCLLALPRLPRAAFITNARYG